MVRYIKDDRLFNKLNEAELKKARSRMEDSKVTTADNSSAKSVVASVKCKPLLKMNVSASDTDEGFTLRDLYSVFIALLPVIMIYRVPFWGKGFSTVLLGLFMPYVAIRLFEGKPRRAWMMVIPILVVFGYFIFRSTEKVENMFLMVVPMVHILCATQNTINTKVLRRVIEGASILSSIIIVIQTLIFYIFGERYVFINFGFVIEDMQHYYFSNFGDGIYRPSGIFVEPSHMAQYACLAVASLLLPGNGRKPDKKMKKKAAFIILGILLSTSGIGMVLCLCIVMYYLIISIFKLSFKRGIVMLVVCSIGVFAVAAAVLRIPVIWTSFERIVGEVDGYNAIRGRTLFYDATVGRLHGIDALIGVGVAKDVNGYMTGFMEMTYRYGYIGYALLIILVLVGAIASGKNSYAWCAAIIYIGLSLVANGVGFINLSFWFCIVYAFASDRLKPWQSAIRETKYDFKHIPLIRKNVW